MINGRLRIVVLSLVVSAGCRREPEFKPVASVKELMIATVDPAADVVYDSVGTIVSASGVQEIAPKNDEEWAAVRNSALLLAESGNLLMMGERAKDRGEWLKLSRALVDAGAAASKAAEAKNAEALLEAGGRVTEACDNCHMVYVSSH
jgi:hypothetical protein